MQSPPVFIVGVGRSGTTILRLMLNAHPHLAIPYESNFLDKFAERCSANNGSICHLGWHELASELLGHDALHKWDYCPTLEQLLERIDEGQAVSVAEAVRHLYTAYAEHHGKRRWGDKSSYIDGIPTIARLFPDCQFIHIVRDGRDVANSVLKLDWGPRDLLEAASWWADHVWLCRRLGTLLGPERYCEVKYEELVENPKTELSRLCDFLGEEFSPAMLEYHTSTSTYIPNETRDLHRNTDKPPMTSRCYAWKSKLSAAQVSAFHRYAGRILDELGYEAAPKVGSLRLGACMAKIYASRIM